MPQELTAEQAAARLKAADTLGMPLGPGQPPAFMRTLAEREDWTDLRVYGPLLKQQSPRVMTTVATPPDADGWCSPVV